MTAAQSSIVTDPQRCGGRPCVGGLRITVGDVLGWLAAGLTTEQIVFDCPELSADDVRACLSYAAECEVRDVRLPAS